MCVHVCVHSVLAQGSLMTLSGYIWFRPVCDWGLGCCLPVEGFGLVVRYGSVLAASAPIQEFYPRS